MFSPYQPNDVHFLFLLPLLGKFSGKRRYRRIVLRLSQSAVLMSAPSSFLRAVFLLIFVGAHFHTIIFAMNYTPQNTNASRIITDIHCFFLLLFFLNSFCMCLRLFLDSKMGVASYLLHTWPITSPVVNLVISAT